MSSDLELQKSVI